MFKCFLKLWGGEFRQIITHGPSKSKETLPQCAELTLRAERKAGGCWGKVLLLCKRIKCVGNRRIALCRIGGLGDILLPAGNVSTLVDIPEPAGVRWKATLTGWQFGTHGCQKRPQKLLVAATEA